MLAGCVPAISTAAFGYPIAEAAEIALTVTRRGLAEHMSFREARFWRFDRFASDTLASRLELMGLR